MSLNRFMIKGFKMTLWLLKAARGVYGTVLALIYRKKKSKICWMCLFKTIQSKPQKLLMVIAPYASPKITGKIYNLKFEGTVGGN